MPLINGAHSIVYSADADATVRFFGTSWDCPPWTSAMAG